MLNAGVGAVPQSGPRPVIIGEKKQGATWEKKKLSRNWMSVKTAVGGHQIVNHFRVKRKRLTVSVELKSDANSRQTDGTGPKVKPEAHAISNWERLGGQNHRRAPRTAGKTGRRNLRKGGGCPLRCL